MSEWMCARVNVRVYVDINEYLKFRLVLILYPVALGGCLRIMSCLCHVSSVWFSLLFFVFVCEKLAKMYLHNPFLLGVIWIWNTNKIQSNQIPGLVGVLRGLTNHITPCYLFLLYSVATVSHYHAFNISVNANGSLSSFPILSFTSVWIWTLLQLFTANECIDLIRLFVVFCFCLFVVLLIA